MTPPPQNKVLDRRQPGQIYLVTDRGERKAAGAYYTPDYVVKYIVENTLGALVAEAKTLYTAQVQTFEVSETSKVLDHPLLAFTAERLAAGQTDVIHDLLAYLAEQMIAMNREKQGLTEAFWLDLEGVTDGATFKKLREKGKQEVILAKQAACALFVAADSRSSRSLAETLGWDEEAFKAFVKLLASKVKGLAGLVDIYRGHAPAYGRLVRRLTATDRLIDRLVYQLYGLTEAEIGIVEG